MTHILPQRNADSSSSLVSFEISPCQTNEETSDLIKRLKCLQFKPPLVAIACHQLDATLSLAKEVQANGFDAMIHIAGGTMTEAEVADVLDTAQMIGLRHILALRGDCVSESTDFPHTADLVRFIRKRTGKYFTIAVGGYPDTHPEAISPEMDIIYLKQKVECGADFILTQVVFTSERFKDFVRRCREVGITVPIVPGILLIENSQSLRKFANICQVEVPEMLLKELEGVENSSRNLQQWTHNVAAQIARDILEAGTSDRAHFFTMNRVQEVQEMHARLTSSSQRT
nr:PREDICTED: probable methylenetetrahydrofolate reductase [Bemisia tabaci]